MEITTTLDLVGQIGVDSGQILVIDPCYILDDEYNPNGEPTGGEYDSICRVTVKRPNHGQVLTGGLGFATGTYYGDGVYPVYAERDSDGAIRRLVIDFVGDQEEESVL